MAFPALFRHLFGDNPVRPFKFRKELIPLDVDAVETFRKSLIGCLIPTTMATLPSCLGIPDGSLFLFEDYPELKEKYDAGGFNGMLLESTASSEEKDAWRGKWIKHSQGLGLYAPRLQGLFLRNAGEQDSLGAYQQDAVQAGIKNIGTRPVPNNNTPTVWITGDVEQKEQDSPDTLYTQLTTVKSNQIVVYTSNQRNSDETRPCNGSLIYGIYLGVSA